MDFGWTAAAATRHSRIVLAFIALLAGLLAGPPGWAAAVREVRVSGEAITISFDDRVTQASAFVLDGPRRTGDGYYESVVLDPDGNDYPVKALGVRCIETTGPEQTVGIIAALVAEIEGRA